MVPAWVKSARVSFMSMGRKWPGIRWITLNVGSDVEQGLEVTRVGSFAAGQVEGDDVAGGVRFCVDFRGEAAARAPERLAFLPPFAPAADTCARTMEESNI